MALLSLPSCVLVVLLTLPARAGAEAGAIAEKVKKALDAAGAKLGVEFQAIPGSTDAFSGIVTRGLKSCDGIDLEVHVRDGGVVELTAYPRLRGERLDASRATDRSELLKRLGASNERIAPLSWAKEPKGEIGASCSVRWSEASAAEDLERALLAAPDLDGKIAELSTCFPSRLTDEEIKERLREAAANDARRGEILAGIAACLQEVEPSRTAGKSTFRKIVLNERGAGLDAFRFRAPAEPAEQRLVWAFAYPPGMVKGWYIVPVGGDGPKFVKFHSGKKYEGTGIPAEHATLLQRTETQLRAGAEYIIWFQFKVEKPVDIYAALSCLPYLKSDRDALPVLEAALGLTGTR